MDSCPVDIDPSTLIQIGRVCDEVWQDLKRKRLFSLKDESEIRRQITRRVMAAVVAGENDPKRLKAWARGFQFAGRPAA
jgi:hypothetical protein